jgi:hypothetical protein
VIKEKDLVSARFAMKLEKILNEILDENERINQNHRPYHIPYRYYYSSEKNYLGEKSSKPPTNQESEITNTDT